MINVQQAREAAEHVRQVVLSWQEDDFDKLPDAAYKLAKLWQSNLKTITDFILDHFPEDGEAVGRLSKCNFCGHYHCRESDGEENFSLWSFLRNVLSTGCAIESDSRSIPRSYEEHSARLDVVAIEFEEKLIKALGIKKRGEQ